jgi:hypothetical protein
MNAPAQSLVGRLCQTPSHGASQNGVAGDLSSMDGQESTE